MSARPPNEGPARVLLQQPMTCKKRHHYGSQALQPRPRTTKSDKQTKRLKRRVIEERASSALRDFLRTRKVLFTKPDAGGGLHRDHDVDMKPRSPQEDLASPGAP